jgi:hypothetical protein
MRRLKTALKPKSETLLSRLASIFTIFSGIIVTAPFLLSLFGKFPKSFIDYIQHSNALLAYIILLCLMAWLFCFSIMFRFSSLFHSWYFEEGNIFGKYRKFRNLSIIANIAAGIIFLILAVIMIDFLFPEFITAVLIGSIIFWLITSGLWYFGFVWYKKSK